MLQRHAASRSHDVAREKKAVAQSCSVHAALMSINTKITGICRPCIGICLIFVLLASTSSLILLLPILAILASKEVNDRDERDRQRG